MAVRRRCGPTTVPRASVPAVEPLQVRAAAVQPLALLLAVFASAVVLVPSQRQT